MHSTMHNNRKYLYFVVNNKQFDSQPKIYLIFSHVIEMKNNNNNIRIYNIKLRPVNKLNNTIYIGTSNNK